MTIIPLADIDPSLVENLLDRAFGPDRRGRTAYRLREGTRQIDELSFAAVGDDGALLGTIQCWPVQFIPDQDGAAVPMILVGPVAVQPDAQRGGIGRLLTHHMLEAAASSSTNGADALTLIGDPEYYGRFFGFTADATGGWHLPGPFEPRRLLARGSQVPAAAGRLEARR